MFATRCFSAARLLPILSVCLLTSANAQTPTVAYSQPDPSADEQFMLERINVARSNPYLEGAMLATLTDSTILQYYSYYSVSPSRLIGDFSTYSAQPPLAMNPKLLASSRRESVDMATHGFQSHTGTDGSTFSQRITDTGYNWGGAGENIYAYSTSAFFGHVGFNADWGVPSLDHRANIMNDDPSFPLYREVGISCVATTKAGYGPMVITQDFGKPADAGVAYVVGVVYADNNHNAAYDQGEGLAGVTVLPSGGTFYALTASAGGFVIPLPTSGSGVLTLTASGGALGAPRVKTIAWTAGTNVKVDFTTADPVAPSGVVQQPVTPTPPTAPTAPTAPVASTPVVTLTVTGRNARADAGLLGWITLSRTGGDTSRALWVKLRCQGTAVGNVDYSALPINVQIPAGAESVDVPITPLGGSDVRTVLEVQIMRLSQYSVPTGQGWGKVIILPN